MGNPLKYFKKLDQKIFICIITLELIKTLVIPNPVDVLVLVGLVIVFLGWFGDEF
ncbi:MAG TPA: hypothetical protein VEC37_07295 [Bacillota bacterium]|nr:hypothetical protein [Bacillota bacterium]